MFSQKIKIGLNMDKRKFWEECNEKFHKQLSDNETVYRYNDFALSCYLAAKEYAQLIIKNLILLNAGALSALPLLYEIFSNDLSENIINAAPWFIMSLFCAMCIAVCAYFNLQFCGKNMESHKAEKYAIALKTMYPTFHESSDIEELEKFIKHNKTKIDKSHFWANIFEFCGILFVAGSVFFLLLGANDLIDILRPTK